MFKQKVALGAWAWGTGMAGGDQVFGNTLTVEELRPVFEEAMKCGLNLWDTAAVYGLGTSEELLGTFVKDVKREDIVISTKFTPQIADFTENAAQNMIDGSKKRLHIDFMDIYWIHNPSDVEKWTPKIIPLVKSGQIKHIGVSNHNLEEIKLANSILAKEGLKISAIQNHYSLLHRSSENGGILDYCKENDITFFAYMVLEQGALTGKYNSTNPFPAGSGRGMAYNKYLPQIEELTKVLQEIADKNNATIAQISIAWAIAKGTLPIIGVTKVNHVQDAYKASQIKLTEEDIIKMEKSAEEIGISTIREWEKSMD